MADKPMTATERKELRRIISARFELLEQELATRRNAIRNRMETEMRQQKAKDIATYEAKIKELTKDAEKLNAKAEALVTEYKAHGLTGTGRPRRGYSTPDSNWQFACEIMTINLSRSLDIADLEKHVSVAVNELLEEHGAAKLDLHKMQLQIEEELAIGSIISEEAQEFLTRIPQASALLPTADTIEVPALEVST